MSLTAPQQRSMPRSGKDSIDIDWGENTAGSETGTLKAGDTVASCVVVCTSPIDPATGVEATDPTLTAVTVNATVLYVNGRQCTAGEATQCTITMGASQAYGVYVLLFTATTTNGWILPRWVKLTCEAAPA